MQTTSSLTDFCRYCTVDRQRHARCCSCTLAPRSESGEPCRPSHTPHTIQIDLLLSPNFQKLRSKLVPSARHFHLDRLMETVDEITANGSVVQIEYVVLDGVNDGDDHAIELGRLLEGRSVYVNLIPYNPNPQLRYSYRSPSEARVSYSSCNSWCSSRRTLDLIRCILCGRCVKCRKYFKRWE